MPSDDLGARADASGGVCGAAGTIAERAGDCASRLCVRGGQSAAIEVPCGEAHDFEWSLVVRTMERTEVWQDMASRLVWSGDSMVSGSEPRLRAFCLEPGEGNASKGRLTAPFWLPSIEAYQAADEHGLRAVLSMEGVVWWTSSLFSDSEAWFFEDGEAGHAPLGFTDEYARARCVAQE